MPSLKSRVTLENLAWKKGITHTHERTTESLIELLLSNYLLYRRELNTIARSLDIKSYNKKSTNELLNNLRKYLVVKKLKDLHLNKFAKRHIRINELDRIQKLNELPHETLKKLGELQRIKNCNTSSKEDLIYALLRSENLNEDRYIASITNNIDTTIPGNEIRAKINDIKETLTRLGSILTNNERNRITKELYKSLKKLNNTNRNTRLRKKQKEQTLLKLIKQNNYLLKKERFMHTDYDDLEYQGISDLKPLYDYINISKYYESELFERALERNYERYRINGDRDKELSLNEYLNTVRTNVNELITKKKMNERKVQLAISIIF